MEVVTARDRTGRAPSAGFNACHRDLQLALGGQQDGDVQDPRLLHTLEDFSLKQKHRLIHSVGRDEGVHLASARYLPDFDETATLDGRVRGVGRGRPLMEHGDEGKRPHRTWLAQPDSGWSVELQALKDCGLGLVVLLFACHAADRRLRLRQLYVTLPTSSSLPYL